MADFKAPLRTVKRVQFGILSPDEIVSKLNSIKYLLFISNIGIYNSYFINLIFPQKNSFLFL